MTTIATQPWPTIQQVAESRQVSEKTVRRAIAAGELAARRFGGRLIRIDPESLEQWGRSLEGTQGAAS